jgi:hypothetical protein
MEAVKYLIEIRLGLSCGLKKSATGLGGRVVGGASCRAALRGGLVGAMGRCCRVVELKT